MKTKIIFFSGLLFAFAGLVSCTSNNSEQSRPNIIFIMSDDHAYQAVSAYGHGLNKTPNIDRIASEGAIFNQSFVTNSICAPSRAVLLTGKYSHINGKVDNVNVFDGDQMTFPKLLQKAGYQTAIVGKWHLRSEPQGFDYWNVLPGQGAYYNPDIIENGEKKRVKGYVTKLITKFALDWLDTKRDKSKPFCLLYHHKAPHRNWKPSPDYLTLYDDKEFDVPSNFFDDYLNMGRAAKEQEMEIAKHMGWGHDFKFLIDPEGNQTRFNNQLKRFEEDQLELWHAAYDPKNQALKDANLKGEELAKWKFNRYIKDYLRCIKSVDDGVGEILDYLDQNGLTKNTLIIYTSDQGFYLGEHGWFDKRFMYEQSLRMPLLIRYPGEIKPGTVIDEMVLNLDFAPAFLDYAGVEIPDEIQGVSFREMVNGENKNWRDAIYYHYYEYPSVHMVKRHYGVRTNRYKLIHFYYDIDEWELYDLEKDPDEMNNVYNDPEYADVRDELHLKLKELRGKYGDSDELSQEYLNTYLDARK